MLVLIIGITAVVAMRQNNKFEAPYPEIKASKDSTPIARGKYLVYGPAHCAHCHTPMDAIERLEKGEEVALIGGHLFEIPPGKFYARNITPDKETGIGNYTDEEIARTLRFGVKKNGSALLDFMPFHNLSDEDLTAVISYLRTTKPIRNAVPENRFNVLGRVVNAFMIKPVGPEGEVPKSVAQGPTPEYGKYLAHYVANCRGCHTERDLKTGKFTGIDFAGGLEFEEPALKGVKFVTPNLTPDKKTGKIADWSEEQFIKRFRAGRQIAASPMPWGPFSRMTDDELKAIYRYLHSLKPVENNTGPTMVAAK